MSDVEKLAAALREAPVWMEDSGEDLALWLASPAGLQVLTETLGLVPQPKRTWTPEEAQRLYVDTLRRLHAPADLIAAAEQRIEAGDTTEETT